MIAESTRARRIPQIPRLVQQAAYERAASLLLALLILCGAVVFCLLAAWLGGRVLFPLFNSVPVTVEQVEGGSESGIPGQSMQLDSPTPQDIARESDLAEPEFQHRLTTVVAAVASRVADVDAPAETNEDAAEDGGGKQSGDQNAPGKGEGAGKPGVPPHLRWQIHFFAGDTLDSYARQLDFFQIELGVLDGDRVLYAKDFNKPKPVVYTGRGGPQETRIYFSWRQGKLLEADRELAERAGIETKGKTLLQFYSEKTERHLLRLEKEYRGVDASKIRKTVFGIRPRGTDFEFFVIDQTAL